MPVFSSFPAWDSLPDFGLYMDQLLLFTQRCVPGELTAGMVNSYVKAGLMDRPKGKKYSRAALAQLLMIASLKQALPLDGLRRLLHPAPDVPAEALYARFLAACERAEADLAGRADASALDLCVEAAACGQLCRRKLEADEENTLESAAGSTNK